MSNRVLTRMKPEEIAAVINGRCEHLKELRRLGQEREDRLAFADRVEKEFGYKALKTAVVAEKTETSVDVILLKTLVGLGIRPLDTDSVINYKAQSARNILNMAMKATGLPLLFASGCAFFALGIAAMLNTPATALGILSNWIPCGMVFGIGFFLVWAEHVFIPRREWLSSELKFSTSAGLLPRECLQLALDIKSELPGVEFQVHQLMKDHGNAFSWAADPDPFLQVHFGGEAYYIAVWDEPGFDGKLMKVD